MGKVARHNLGWKRESVFNQGHREVLVLFNQWTVLTHFRAFQDGTVNCPADVPGRYSSHRGSWEVGTEREAQWHWLSVDLSPAGVGKGHSLGWLLAWGLNHVGKTSRVVREKYFIPILDEKCSIPDFSLSPHRSTSRYIKKHVCPLTESTFSSMVFLNNKDNVLIFQPHLLFLCLIEDWLWMQSRKGWCYLNAQKNIIIKLHSSSQGLFHMCICTHVCKIYKI